MLHRLDEERRTVTCRGGPIDTAARFVLEETARGHTRLTLRHEGFGGLGGLIPRLVLGRGWQRPIGTTLPALLQARAAAPATS